MVMLPPSGKMLITIDFDANGVPVVHPQGPLQVRHFAMASFLVAHMGHMLAIQSEAMAAAEAHAIADALGKGGKLKS